MTGGPSAKLYRLVQVTIENAAGSSFVTQTNMNAAGFPGY
jgi:hypothetical protein